MSQPNEPPRYVTCRCQYCDKGIEFDANRLDVTGAAGNVLTGQTIACPHCGLETILFVPNAGVSPATARAKRGLWGWVSNRLEQRRVRNAHARAERMRMQEEQLQRRKAYVASIISNLKEGKAPRLTSSSFMEEASERIWWIEPSTLYELRTLTQKLRGELVFCDLETLNELNEGRASFGGKAFVPLSKGELIITDKRLAFVGSKKSFTTKLENLFHVQLSLNRIQLSEKGRQNPRVVRFKGNGDIVCEVLRFALEAAKLPSPTNLGPKFSQGRVVISSDVRREVWRRDGGKCVRCGSRERLEYDHIVPVSKGGSNTARNIELLCENCNRSKSDSIQ